MHLCAFCPTPSLPKLISLPTAVRQPDIMWMFLYISPVFVFDQLTWQRKPSQDVLSLFTQFSSTVGGTLNWLKFEQRDYAKKAGWHMFCAMILPFITCLSWFFAPPPTNNTMKSKDEPWAWDAAPGPCGKEKWFCGRLGQIVDIKNKADRGISKDQHEHWRCCLFIVSPRVLGFASIIVVLEWPLWKMNSNGKATNRLTGDSRLPFSGPK